MTRTVVIDTFGSGFDTLLGVYRGPGLCGLRRVAGNDDARFPQVLTSKVTVRLLRGVNYHIAVDGYDGATGGVVLRVRPA